MVLRLIYCHCHCASLFGNLFHITLLLLIRYLLLLYTGLHLTEHITPKQKYLLVHLQQEYTPTKFLAIEDLIYFTLLGSLLVKDTILIDNGATLLQVDVNLGVVPGEKLILTSESNVIHTVTRHSIKHTYSDLERTMLF